VKPDQPPTSPIDRDVADAFAALDRAVDAGAADDLADRVLARVGDEPPGRASGSPVSEAPPGTPEAEPGAEDSGLHDIRKLASNARKRFGERDGSEADGDDSAVLLTTAQGGLRGVALPDPRAAQRVGPNGVRAGTEARRDARSSAPFWVLGSVATLAAAAAVAVFVFGIGREQTDGLGGAQTAAEPGAVVARAEQAPPAGTAASSLEAPGPQAAPPPPPPPDPELAASAADSTAAPVETASLSRRRAAKKPEPAEAKAVAQADRAKGRAASEAEEGARAGVVGGVEGGAVGGVEGGAVGGVEDGPDAPGSGAPGQAPGQGGGTVSLDEMLDQATGKATRPSPESEAERKKKAEQAKRGLERADVTDGLAAVADAVQRCAAVDGTRGTVTVKFVVGPDGQVRSSSATGDHARSKTGACVSSAVTRARFPRFEGDPVTINYPFSLRGP
jgi:outer membrane biosynthesis protein TonB